jgi:hypothetical protein
MLSEKWIYKINITVSLTLLWMLPILCLLWPIIPIIYLIYKKMNLFNLNKMITPVLLFGIQFYGYL